MKKLVISKDKDKDTIAMSVTTVAGEFYSGTYKLDNTACARCFNSLTERAGLDLCIDAEDSICLKEFIHIMYVDGYVTSSIIKTLNTVIVTLVQGSSTDYHDAFLDRLIYGDEEF